MNTMGRYILVGNMNYKGWQFIASFKTKKEAKAHIKEYSLMKVTWQWVLTDTLQTHECEVEGLPVKKRKTRKKKA